MQLRRPLAAVLVALSVGAAACGTQVSDNVRRRAAEALLDGGSGGAGGVGGGAGGLGGGAGTGTDVSGAGGITTAGPGGGSGSAGGSGGSGAAGAASGSTAAKSGGGGGASGGGCAAGSGKDVGLTPSSVTVGTIADLTGPVPGLFEGAVEGTQAFAAYANSSGGLCGRQLKVQAVDDGTDCGQNQSDTQQLIGSVFAFVGSFSLYDDCGAKVLGQHPDVADVHRTLGLAAGQVPNNFSPAPAPAGYANGMFTYYAKKFGGKVKNVGTLYPNIPAAAASAHWIDNAAASAGWQFTYQRAVGATETDWTSDFVKMCQQKHIQIFFTAAATAKNAATMVQDEQKAGCPELVNIIPVAYDQAFLQDFGDNAAAEGILGYNQYALFFNTDEAQRIPELGRLQQWFQRVYPSKQMNLYAMYSWADGLLFQQAMKAVGPNASRKALTAALHGIHTFDANGLVAPSDPSSKSTGPTCYVLWQIHAGQFQRVDTPATGYRCDGTFVPYNGS